MICYRAMFSDLSERPEMRRGEGLSSFVGWVRMGRNTGNGLFQRDESAAAMEQYCKIWVYRTLPPGHFRRTFSA